MTDTTISWACVYVYFTYRLDTLLRLRLCYIHIIAWACVYVSRGKGEQRTDRACLEIRLYREIEKRTCLHTDVCMCEYK